MLTAEEQKRVCDAARAYLDVAWRGQGRDHNGVDCIGLIVMAYRDAGFEIDEGVPDYRSIDPKRLVETLLRYCDRLARGELLMPGDVVVYGAPREAHCGLIADGRNGFDIIHCPMNRAVVETRFDPNRGQIKGIYRWRS